MPLNFFHSSNPDRSREEFHTLLTHGDVTIERIASHGHASPDGFWYDQTDDEWVMLVQGQAVLDYGEDKRVELRAGDCEFIARGVRHRVASVSDDALWLAVHMRAKS